jgi:hypothetical protein
MPTYVASQLDELGASTYWSALLERARRLNSDLSNDASTLLVERGPRHLDRGIAFDTEPSASTCESHSSEGSRGASTPLADGLPSAARIHRPVCVRAPPAAPGARRSIPAASIPSFLADRGRSVRQRRRARDARSVVAIKLAACRPRRLGSMCAGKGLEILALAAGGRGRGERRSAPTAGTTTRPWPTTATRTSGRVMTDSDAPAHVSMPAVHRAAALLKRWLLGTYQGAVRPEHLQANLRRVLVPVRPPLSRRCGLLFYRLRERAVPTGPLPHKTLKDRRR